MVYRNRHDQFIYVWYKLIHREHQPVSPLCQTSIYIVIFLAMFVCTPCLQEAWGMHALSSDPRFESSDFLCLLGSTFFLVLFFFVFVFVSREGVEHKVLSSAVLYIATGSLLLERRLIDN